MYMLDGNIQQKVDSLILMNLLNLIILKILGNLEIYFLINLIGLVWMIISYHLIKKQNGQLIGKH